MTRRSRFELAVLLALGVFFVLVPQFVESRFWLGFWTTTLFFALLGQSWNVLGGYAGQMSFGHALFFGTGAYATAVMQVRFGLDAWTSAALGVGARKIADGYSWDGIARRLVEIYEQLAVGVLPQRAAA